MLATSGFVIAALVCVSFYLALRVAGLEAEAGARSAEAGPVAEQDSPEEAAQASGRIEAHWPLRHGDPENTDYLPVPGAAHLEPAWFHGPDMPIGTYVAVAGEFVVFHTYNDPKAVSADGHQCHLWVLDRRTGEVAWCTAEVRQTVTSAAIDRQGRIFISDGEALHAFSLDGERLWRTEVAGETSSVTLMPGGALLVADYAGVLNAHDPDTGAPLAAPYQLPAQANPVGEFANVNAPGMLKTGVDAGYLDTLIQNYFGYGLVIQDMPAVSSRTGRIFIASNSEDGETGALWAVDFSAEDGFSPACRASIGVGSDTSPAISQDGRTVYVAAAGLLHAISADDCREIWRVERPGFAAASPSVSPDGMVYLLSGGGLSAFRDTGETAEPVWTYRLDDDAAELGFANGIFDSAILLSEDYADVTVSFGIQQPGYIIPFAHSLYVIDRRTGARVSRAALGEESDSPPSMSRDGWVYVPTKALARGHSHSMHMLGGSPEGLSGLALREPMTGVYAFRPVSDGDAQ